MLNKHKLTANAEAQNKQTVDNASTTQIEFASITKTQGGVNCVNARELHKVLKVGKMFTHWIEDRIEKYGFVEGEDYEILLAKNGKQNNSLEMNELGVFPKKGKQKRGGHNRKDYLISFDMAKELGMIQNNPQGRAVRKYFIEAEKKNNRPKTRLELAKENLELIIEIERIEAERDHAIATKAQIGSKREATAMARASVEARRAKALEDRLQDVSTYRSLKAWKLPMYTHDVQTWRILKTYSVENGYDIKKLEDANYGTVNGYHKDVIDWYKDNYNIY